MEEWGALAEKKISRGYREIIVALQFLSNFSVRADSSSHGHHSQWKHSLTVQTLNRHWGCWNVGSSSLSKCLTNYLLFPENPHHTKIKIYKVIRDGVLFEVWGVWSIYIFTHTWHLSLQKPTYLSASFNNCSPNLHQSCCPWFFNFLTLSTFLKTESLLTAVNLVQQESLRGEYD